MARLVLLIVAVAGGVSLVSAGHLEIGLALIVFGGLSLIALGQRLRGHQDYARQQRLVATLGDDVDARIARREPPDQMAAAFATRGVVPIVLLQLLARHVLQELGHGADREQVGTAITWLASSRGLPPPPELDLAELDTRRTLHAMTAGVTRFGDDSSGAVWHGALIATRWHLIFVTDPNYESLTTAFVKGFAFGWLPPSISLSKLGHETALLTRETVADQLGPTRIAEFVEWFGKAGSVAIEWRGVAEVEKSTASNDHTRVDLVITTETPACHRFRLGTGLNESFVEDWIDLTREAAALQGVFLPPRF